MEYDPVKDRLEALITRMPLLRRLLFLVLRQVFLREMEVRRQLRALNAVNTLRAFREKAESIRDQEVQKALRALEKGDAATSVLESLARTLTNKLIHTPSVQMKKASADGRDDLLLLTRQLYELDQAAEQPQQSASSPSTDD